MNADTLLLAVAIALSPTGVLACVLLLTTERGTTKAWAFAIGWVAAIGAVGALTLVADSLVDSSSDAVSTGSALVSIGLGAVLLVVAVRRRARAGDGPEEPSWMGRLDRMPVPVALGFGLFMPPYVVAAAAANSIVKSSGSGGVTTTAVCVVVVVASLGVLVPCVVAVTAPQSDRWISAWRSWLLRKWTTVLFWLLIVVGVWLVGKGVYELLS